MAFALRQIVWGLAMMAIGAALGVLAYRGILPSDYVVMYFVCLMSHMFSGPWLKSAIVLGSGKPVKKNHLYVVAGLAAVAMVLSVLTKFSIFAAPLFTLMMEYTYFRWVDKATLPEGIEVV